MKLTNNKLLTCASPTHKHNTN